MPFHKIVLVCNPSQPLAAQLAGDLARFLHPKGVQSEILNDYRLLPQIPQADLCISLGGDGTALRCARQTAPLGLPLLAINCGSLGFLSACEAQDAQHYLAQILDGNYSTTHRALLQGTIRLQNADKIENLLAFNDCVIKTTSPLAFTLRADWNGKELKHFYGDGVIISTPAGSTAYSLAAGGPILAPDLDAWVITPICPHSLTERPLVLRADGVLSFEPVFKNHQDNAVVSFDGQHSYSLQPGDKVCLQRCPHQARLISAGTYDFFGRLRQKLEWGNRNA